MKLVKSVIILLAGFLSTACIDETLLSINRSYYTDNVAIQDIDAEVVVKRYKMGYYEDLGNNHEHTDEHYHDQNDGMQFGDELQQFRSL